MWLATRHGFFSVVEKEDGFHIRARVEKDLENLSAVVRKRFCKHLPAIETWPDADYRYRIIVDIEDGKAAIFALVMDVDYDNFKSEIAATPGQKHKLPAYHEIWRTMHALQYAPR